MLSLSTPIELAVCGHLDTSRKWTCEKCRFHESWHHTAKYNLWMGVLFPGLWAVNVLLFFVFHLKGKSLCTELHSSVEENWQEIVGYSLCGAVVYSTIALIVVFVIWG